MDEQTVNTLENMYDKYSPMLYGIAAEIASSQKEAEQILLTTFQKAHRNDLIEKNKHSLCASLIKLTIQTAHEQLKPKNNFKLKQFENTPLLHKLLCEQINLEDHCTENKITRTQVLKQIRKEFNSIRNTKAGETKTRELFQQSV